MPLTLVIFNLTIALINVILVTYKFFKRYKFMKVTNIATDGTVLLEGTASHGTSVIYVSGTFGIAGTAKLVVPNGLGGYSDLVGGAITGIDTRYTIEHGIGMPIYVTTAVTDGTTALVFQNAGL